MQNNKGEVIDISKVHIRLRSGIKTPCVDICKMDPSNGQCFGCSRKRDEIANWGRMTDEQRDQVIEDLPNRKM